jgi:hypothetical protein
MPKIEQGIVGSPTTPKEKKKFCNKIEKNVIRRNYYLRNSVVGHG